MKLRFKTPMAAALAGVMGTTAMADGKVVIYNWFEYIPQDLLDKFTKETGIEVVMDTYDSNEALLAALKAGAIGAYDVAMPGDYMVEILNNQDLLGEFSPDELKNFDNIQDQWLNVEFDAGRKHSIPYQWGTTSFTVNRDVYKGPIDSLSILFDPPEELKGKINMLDAQNDVLALASIYLGIPQCTQDRDQLKKLNDVMQSAKQNWVSMNSDTTKDILVSGDVAVSMIWNGFGARARMEGANLEYAFPKEGYIVWMDNVVLLKDAPDRENALKFMDFLLEPENIAAVSNYARYDAGVKGAKAKMDEDLRTQPEMNAPEDGNGVFVKVCDVETQAVYDQIWINVKK
ncbi:extracellular solute-binding protein (plasmid) [Aquicoccus sp. G2-2]|uniref:extracellular solute-binding protein n=1 Tax=Aquicoccus sp. G2-2 TaxID=3092120 RepID=UPI002AE07A27|nr:extracellular solute-binding protein [Aquicoccus sp. G2-2]MEA1112097.1 extracellular solute-binding protein [Aquicoccus sp. G2-2]